MNVLNAKWAVAGLAGALTAIYPAGAFQPDPDPAPAIVTRNSGSYLGVGVVEVTAERAKAECIVVLLMVWVRMDSGSPDLRGQPMCRLALKSQYLVAL